MRERLFELECPWCGHSFFLKRDTWLNADHNTEGLICSGAYFRHRCSKCGQVFSFFHPFLYHDPEKKFTVVLTEKEKAEPGMYVSHSPEDFCEMVRILSRDEVPERIIKLRDKVRTRTGRPSLRYETTESGCFWFVDEQGSLAVKENRHE